VKCCNNNNNNNEVKLTFKVVTLSSYRLQFAHRWLDVFDSEHLFKKLIPFFSVVLQSKEYPINKWIWFIKVSREEKKWKREGEKNGIQSIKN
jgi:hypothetical protein